MSTGIIGGSKKHWVATRDANGYPMGSNLTPDTVVNDTVYTPNLRTCGYIQKGAMGTTPSVITWQEGNEICGKLDMGISDVSDFETEFASKSFEYDDLVQGVTETSPASAWELGGLNTGETLLPDLICAFGVYYKKSDGTTSYLTSIYNNVQIRPPDVSNSQADGTNPNTFSHSFTPSKSDRLVTGDAVSTTYTNYRYVMHIVSDDGWMWTETYIGDGVEVTATMTYLPTNSDATGTATNRVTKDGATQALSSFSTSTAVATWAVAPAAGTINVLTYPTLFVTP